MELSVGEVAARAGLAPSAVRWYEAQGLVSSTRTAGGARRYPRSVLRRLAFVRAAQNVGLSLAEIRSALGTLPEGRTPTARDWARLSAGWRSRLDEQIAALTQLRDGLDSCIGCGCLSLDRCALSNAGDLAAQEGPGARWLHPALRAGRRPPDIG
ncbi:Redox-sensitive transcriptional activator soxR [Modestobacter italicus]|uniref:Redox-sensitive transcriptional activator soxR n=1 Tax=Modestobacter italicus (strain DSM 44449 / CECT 9708 / BC 501) TaxID=2732864 RepID=I4EXT4_MODI5|nr:redox-sensitive transcriptional activator SoxR [Modestobacter marinus]CCH88197.1 Redox-sensitive transcriptional activator soxR [Modestobacter marinus]